MAKKELAVDPRSYDDHIAYAGKLADEYIELSDRASAAQDTAALALIGTAGVAAGGLLFDGSLDLVKGAGLAAGGLTAATTYFNPGEASQDLLDAAEQLLCIAKVAVPEPRQHEAALEALKEGITTARLNLRKKLQHTLPDYKQLLQAYKASAEQRFFQNESGRELVDLQNEIRKCLL